MTAKEESDFDLGKSFMKATGGPVHVKVPKGFAGSFVFLKNYAKGEKGDELYELLYVDRVTGAADVKIAKNKEYVILSAREGARVSETSIRRYLRNSGAWEGPTGSVRLRP